MTMPSSLKLIIEGIAQSKRLLELASKGEWDSFFDLETQRHDSLINLKLEPVGPTAEEYRQIRSKMEELVELNDQIEQVCKLQRAELAEHLRQFTKSNKAHKAYSKG